jgi:hypothetical protein
MRYTTTEIASGPTWISNHARKKDRPQKRLTAFKTDEHVFRGCYAKRKVPYDIGQIVVPNEAI